MNGRVCSTFDQTLSVFLGVVSRLTLLEALPSVVPLGLQSTPVAALYAAFRFKSSFRAASMLAWYKAKRRLLLYLRTCL